MSWACELTEDARNDLRALQRRDQKRISRTVDQMELDPFQGNIQALKGGEWKGVFRKRVGPFRIFFVADHNAKKVTIIRVVRRTEKTYD
jgi:mRNA-degrading endonuclease RelE of RelBE toxin-antitoxin system